MEPLVKSLGKFVSRDLLYVAAGLILVCTTVEAFQITLGNLTSVGVFLVLIISYISCYTAQEVLAILKVLCLQDAATSNSLSRVYNIPAKLDLSILDRLSDSELENIKNNYWYLEEPPPERIKEQIERFIFLRDICVKFGTALTLSPIIFISARLLNNSEIGFAEVLFCALSLLGGLFLCGQSYFRSTQTAWHIVSYMRNNNPTPND